MSSKPPVAQVLHRRGNIKSNGFYTLLLLLLLLSLSFKSSELSAPVFNAFVSSKETAYTNKYVFVRIYI